jgi:hypothetical protein
VVVAGFFNIRRCRMAETTSEARRLTPSEEWGDIPRKWDELTALEQRVEEWRKKHGLSNWCPPDQASADVPD